MHSTSFKMFLATGVLALGCVVNTSGAPCSSDNSCPSGQVCVMDHCQPGASGTGGGSTATGGGGGTTGGGSSGGGGGSTTGGGGGTTGGGGGSTTGGGGGAAGGGTAGTAVLTLTPSTQDFGQVTQGGQSGAQTFTVANTGLATSGTITTTLNGTDATHFVVTADGCVGQTLAANSSCQISVRFTPRATGPRVASLDVAATPGNSVSAALSGTGLALGSLTISPMSRDFGSTQEGLPGATQIFTVQNTGGSPTGALVAAIGGTNQSDFVISANPCSGQVLAASATCTVSARFLPNSPGSKIANLTVTGTPGGTAIAALTAIGLANAQLDLSPPSTNYNSVVTGSSANATFTVSNSGGVPSGVPTAMLGGSDAAQFSIQTNNCTAAVPAGGMCTLVVRFSPTSTGVKNANLAVAAPGTSSNANLTGTGIGQGALSISPSNQDFGSFLQGTSSAAISFTVTNTGGAATGTLSSVIAGSADFVIFTENCAGLMLGASAQCLVTVKFSPTSAGGKSGTLQVSGTPGGTAPASLTGTGLAPAQLSMSPAAFTFADTLMGATSTPQSFLITNTGGVAAGTTTALITVQSGADLSQFSIGPNTCAGALGAGSSCTIAVSFSPTRMGALGSSLTVSATPGGAAAATLSGTGQTPASLTLRPATGSSTAFGNVVVNTPAFMTYLVANAGQQTSSAVTVTLSGTDFSVVTGAGTDCVSGVTTLAGSASCEVRVRFAPSANVTRSASLSATAVVGGTPGSLTLTGTGQNPGALSGMPASNDFGQVEVGQSSASFNWTITNSGNLPTTAMMLTNTNSADFTTTSTCGATLPALSFCVVTVTFRPGSGGARSGTLQMSYAEGLPISFPMTGVGMFRLTINRTGTGTVTSSGLSCGATCTALFTSGTPLTLRARTVNGDDSFFSGWGGACASSGSSRDCVISMTANQAVSATFSPMSNNLAFASSRTYAGGGFIGGVANADSECNIMATAAGINNSAGNGFIAWLSSSTSNVLARMGATARGWVRLDGKPLFDTQAKIAANQIWHPINRTENGDVVTTNLNVATGTTGAGLTVSQNCMDWTVSSGASFGAFGTVKGGPLTWSNENNFNCTLTLRLYCLGKTKSAPLTPVPFAGAAKFAFVSLGSVTPDLVAGSAELDALCNVEKQAAVGPMKAWVAPTGASAAPVLVASTNYKTVDGLLIGTGAELNGGTFFQNGAGMWEFSNQTFPSNFDRVFTGSASPLAIGVDTTNCVNWSSNAAGGTATTGLFMLNDGRWWNFLTQACNVPSHVHCIEQ